jgi:acyl-CoA thioesterase YciA
VNRRHGGWIMASMDAAAMATTRFVEGRTVTIAVSGMVFVAPVKVGDSVRFHADLKRMGRPR